MNRAIFNIPTVLFCLLILAAAQPGRADLLDNFRAEYPAAARQLEDAYSHVKIYGTKTTRDNKPGSGHIVSVQKEQYFRDGGNVLHEVSWIKSNDPQTPVGTIQIASGSSEKSFFLRKTIGNEHFEITRHGSLPNFWTDLRLHLYPLFAVDYMMDEQILDYCHKPNVEFLSAKMMTINGAQAIDVMSQETVKGDVKACEFYFQPKTWALMGWMIAMRGEKYPPNKRAYMWCRIQYLPGSSPPKLATLKYWTANVRNSDKRPLYEYEISKVEFGPIPANQFALAAFGVEMPGPATGPSGVVWAIVSAVVLVILVLSFGWLERKRRGKTD